MDHSIKLPSRVFKEQEDKGEYWLLFADIDKDAPKFDGLIDVIKSIFIDSDFEAYTSKSATEQNHRARVIIPIIKPLFFRDWSLCQELFNDLLERHGVTPDRSNERAAQLCYLPNRGEIYYKESNRSGRIFDPLIQWNEQLQQKRDAIKTEADKLEAHKKVVISRREALKLSDSPNAIGAFNQAYTAQEVLQKAGYTQRGSTFRHPNSESGSFSANVKDERVHSLSSSSDPLYTDGDGSHDAFSVFTVLFHNNDQNEALKDAGDNWLKINDEPWNKVKQREYIQEQSNITDWQPPISLESAKLPPWPDDIFPGSIQNFATALSASTETPPELSAMMVLAAISAASQGKYRVRVKSDYFEPVNIWTCAALPPGSRKTAVQMAATAPLTAWEKVQREKLEPEIKEA